VVPDKLQKVGDRITDEAIHSDHQVIEGLRVRLRKLNEQGNDAWPMDNYYICKAQAWIDFGEVEYTDNDRGTVVDHALEQARILITKMESGEKNISHDTAIIPESMIVRQDLWDFANAREKIGGPQCTDCNLARLEVQLVAAGHDHAELGWRHAASGVLASERLARAVRSDADGCAVADGAGIGPVVASAVGIVQAPSAPAPAAPAPKEAPLAFEELRVPANVHFAYNKSLLSNETSAVLARVSQILRAYPQITVVLVGHTDARGGTSFNNALSKRRAEAVRVYLIAAGINVNRITDEARGKSQSLNSKLKQIEAFALDRRVELVFENLPNIKTERQDVDVQADF
jgi:OmpA-OmpF porin, OOP family